MPWGAGVPVSPHDCHSLLGRNVIFTGGSRGLGKVMALALVEHGANVMITGARSTDDLADTETEAKAIGGGECLAMLAGTGDPESCERVARETICAFGSVGVLLTMRRVGRVGASGK